MRRTVPAFFFVAVLAVAIPKLAAAQQFMPKSAGLGISDSAPALNAVIGHSADPAPLPERVVLPRMAPELALEVMANHAIIQGTRLGSYSAVSTVTATLPDLSEHGQFELDR